jgi:hypothetical protein
LGGSSYLLDDYPADAAFSLRQLKAVEVDVIRVRRDSDSAEADFTPTEINDGTLTTWTGANVGFIVKWYDQEGTNHAVQATAGNQPWIVDASGNLRTLNGEPMIDFSPSGAHKPPLICGSTTTIKTAWVIGCRKTINNGNFAIGESGGNGLIWGGSSGGFDGTAAYDGTNFPSLSNEDALVQHVDYWSMRSSKIYIDRDASGETDKGTFAASLALDDIGGRSDTSTVYGRGYMQEVIFYNSDESGSKSAIETDINDFYGAY